MLTQPAKQEENGVISIKTQLWYQECAAFTSKVSMFHTLKVEWQKVSVLPIYGKACQTKMSTVFLQRETFSIQ
jgi:hypothetical protein